VREIARMLDLEATLGQRAAGLTADGKQKISLGRGLVRSDVNVIMFDEPLTVIDPHLKWVLRSKLKELHQRTGRTMIYVTHDQTEALTFAEEVVVMHEGQVVQTGTPVELFEQPRHTFVGYFIGSPGMNLLAGELDGDHVRVDGERIAYAGRLRADARPGPGARVELGIRPEFLRFAAAGESGLPVRVLRSIDAGRYRIVDVQTRSASETKIKLLLPEGAGIPGDDARLVFDAARTHLYIDGWLATEALP
jgi:glycerol transport system ATP-binding protein